MAAEILPAPHRGAGKPLVLADKEHYSQELFRSVRTADVFDLLCAQPAYPLSLKRWSSYGQMTMAWAAQAAIHQLRERLGQPAANWDAEHLARNLFHRLEGDIRVRNDTILVTYYNAPNAELLRAHYQNLPQKLRQQGINPKIPWLYNYQLDFRFK